MAPIRKVKASRPSESDSGNGHTLVTRRASPTANVDPFHRLFGRFGSFLPGFGAWDPFGTVRQPIVDIRDCGNEYEVRFEVPGVAKENLECFVTDDRLELNATTNTEHEDEEDGDYYYRESGHQSFFRSVPLPPDADPGLADARLEDGILRVTIGKSEGGASRRRNVRIR